MGSIIAAETAGIITTEMLQPIVNAISSNVGSILPVGLTIFGIVVGIGLVPKIIYKFL